MIFDTHGKKIVSAKASHSPLISPDFNWFEHPKGELWAKMVEAFHACLKEFKGDVKDIVAIGLGTQRACNIYLDKEGNEIYNTISWMDQRWWGNVPKIGELPPDAKNPYHYFYPYYSLVNFMKFYVPELYEKIDKVLNVSAFCCWKMTGKFCETYGNNLRYPWDLEHFKPYDTDAEITAMGMKPSQLPEPVMPGTKVGGLSAAAAKELGLPEGLPVVLTAGDKQNEMVGAGAINEGNAYMTLGTLCGYDVVSKKWAPSLENHFMTYGAGNPGFFNYEASIQMGMSLVTWFKDQFYYGFKEEAAKQGVSIESIMDKEAEHIPAGCDGLFVMPDWIPDSTRPASKGMFLGYDSRHGRGHMFRALVEGIVQQLKLGFDIMDKEVQVPVSSLYIGGGGSKADFIAQIVADVFNLPVQRLNESENCSLGAAMLAAVGVGVYPDVPVAVKAMIGTSDPFTPNAANNKVYKELRDDVMLKIYPAMEPVLKRLAEICPPAAK